MPKNENTASASITDANSILLKMDELSRLGTGIRFQQDGDQLIIVLDLSHEGYTTQPKPKKQADGSTKLTGGGNIMVGTSHGNQVFVNADGSEVKIGVNAYKKAPVV